jgi:hypothetical protein
LDVGLFGRSVAEDGEMERVIADVSKGVTPTHGTALVADSQPVVPLPSLPEG